MRKFDPQERAILKELIRNPRSSDHKIALSTKIPAMTVGRKRKKLEKEGIIHYFVSLDHSETGTSLFSLRKLYIIKFKIGITASQFLEIFERDSQFQHFNQEYIEETYLSEKDGHFALVMILDALTDAELLESFNGFIIPHLKQLFGDDSIEQISTVKLHQTVRQHHNYLPHINMENGIIKKEWDQSKIFVDEVHHEWAKFGK